MAVIVMKVLDPTRHDFDKPQHMGLLKSTHITETRDWRL